MTRFASLSVELQELIFEKLREVDEPLHIALKNASLTCKAWRHLAACILFRRLVFEVDALSEPSELATGYLEFLKSHEHLHPYVREVVVPIGCPNVTKEWSLAFLKLLPCFRNLKHISIGGDKNAHPDSRRPRGSQESISMNKLRNALFYVSNHGRNVTVTLQHYTHLLDHKTLDLSLLAPSKSQESTFSSSLTSLRISFVHYAYNLYESWRTPDYPIYPSSELAALLEPHKNLEHLFLQLPGSESCGWHHVNYENESSHALEKITPITPYLKSLTLHGDFSISDEAWSHWRSIPWSKLESLTLVGTSMVKELTKRLADQSLPSLQTLKLAPYMHIYNNLLHHTPAPRPGKISLNVSVPQLSLTGYQSAALMEYLSRSTRNATSLRKLRFHSIEPGAGPGLSVFDIEQLSICTQLSWLGLDIPRDFLPNNNNNNDKFGPGSSWQGYLDAVARLRPLQHLRTFIHNGYSIEDGLSRHDVITMFRYIHSRKQGCPLQSLVICEDQGARRGLWVARAWSEDKIVLDYRLPVALNVRDIWDFKVARSIEICDTRTMEKVQDCATQWKYWKGWWVDETEDLFWGLAEGW
ncbi:hypothetical protein F4811DRAFT_352365 [Daldinia bambusicola]|nr:hypothetical protein F4811DRAFT_352365 [Daldinia bambusicola]